MLSDKCIVIQLQEISEGTFIYFPSTHFRHVKLDRVPYQRFSSIEKLGVETMYKGGKKSIYFNEYIKV